jgi:SAM-dependent methyltransferase
MDRRDIVLGTIDAKSGRGLEIGPLSRPIITREIGPVFYVDHVSTQELIHKYKHDPSADVGNIVNVDFVWGEKTLAQCVGDAAPFDYVVASHVLEHVPDLIGWLREVGEVLRPGGRISLVLPDRRFTFDVRRRDTDISEVMEAHLLRVRRPAVRAVFDHFYKFVHVDPLALWSGDTGYAEAPFDVRAAMEISSQAATGQYFDCHSWVFSDATFVALLRSLMELDLVDFGFVAFTPTRANDSEFFATLEKPMRARSREERIRENLASLPKVPVPEIPPPPPAPPPAPVVQVAAPAPANDLVPSSRELDLIRFKRQVLDPVWRTVHHVRARVSRR